MYSQLYVKVIHTHHQHLRWKWFSVVEDTAAVTLPQRSRCRLFHQLNGNNIPWFPLNATVLVCKEGKTKCSIDVGTSKCCTVILTSSKNFLAMKSVLLTSVLP